MESRVRQPPLPNDPNKKELLLALEYFSLSQQYLQWSHHFLSRSVAFLVEGEAQGVTCRPVGVSKTTNLDAPYS